MGSWAHSSKIFLDYFEMFLSVVSPMAFICLKFDGLYLYIPDPRVSLAIGL